MRAVVLFRAHRRHSSRLKKRDRLSGFPGSGPVAFQPPSASVVLPGAGIQRPPGSSDPFRLLYQSILKSKIRAHCTPTTTPPPPGAYDLSRVSAADQSQFTVNRGQGCKIPITQLLCAFHLIFPFDDAAFFSPPGGATGDALSEHLNTNQSLR